MNRYKLLIILSVAAIAVTTFSLTGFGGSQRVIEGRVLSPFGPVADVRMRVAGDINYALTDREGKFVLGTAHLPNQRLMVTAGKDGWFNNAGIAAPAGKIRDIVLNPLPMGDRPDYRFISPVTCSRCHAKVTRYWDRSKMAHTTANPKVLGMYYGTDAGGRGGIGPGYKIDNPKDNGNCAICHAPSAAVSYLGTRDLNNALWSPRTEWEGISCDYCHKVRKVVKKTDQPSHYAPVLKRHNPAKGNSIMVFGPYDDVVNGIMAASYSPVFDQGRFCATCHNHFKQLPRNASWDHRNVYTDEEWAGFGLKDNNKLPIQTTYLEWKQWQDALPADDSNKGKKCQDCHMSWRKEMLPYDNYVVDGQARQMWGVKRSPKQIRPHHFDGGTATQLKTALSMEVEGEVIGETLKVRVFITNTNGGHWVPTGETMRSVMLLVEAADSHERPLKMLSGTRLPAWAGQGNPAKGNFAGLPGKVFARVLQDDRGNLNVPFWKATGVAFDSRIRPKKTVTLEFTFAVKDPDDEPTAKAKLIYRPVFKDLAAIKNWKTEDILITNSVW
jgi:hypothetical protein